MIKWIKDTWIFYIISIFYKMNKWLLIVTVLLNVFLALIPMIQMVALAHLIDSVIKMQKDGYVLSMALIPIIVIMILLIIKNFSNQINNLIKVSFINCLRLKYTVVLSEKKAKLEYKHLENPKSLDLITRVMDLPEEKLYDCLFNLVGTISLFITIISLASTIIYYMWYIGLLLIIVTIPLMILAVKGGHATYEANKIATKYRRKYQYYEEVLTSRETSLERTLFAYGKKLNEMWKENYEIARKINFKTMSKWIIKSSAYGVISTLVLAIIIACLIYISAKKIITIGIFIALVNAIYQLNGNMTYELSWKMESLVKSKEYINELRTFLLKTELKAAISRPTIPAVNFESLQFKNVWFKYPGVDTYILKGTSFMLEKGKHYSFVGVNGAGKSTIVKLIIGLYSDYKGEILLNGKPISEFSQSELKSICATAFQDFTRYFINVYDNIRIGNINKINDESEIQKGINILNLNDLINDLPQGLQSNLGKLFESGVDLSGGQWQKLALARFYVNPGTLKILDEPTAALDPISESNIYKDFELLSKNKTAIFISHRLGATKLADTILVLHDGVIVEKGNHSDLVEKNGVYAEMFESQRMWYL
ncbi:MAG: ABC transporter ATP-binding protein [Clostridiales bacterium]